MPDANARPLPRDFAKILVFGFAGRIGSGASFVRDKVLQSLRTYEYDVDIVDVTKILENMAGQLDEAERQQIETDLADTATILSNDKSKRVRKFQLLGNAFRRKWGNQILAVLAVTEFIEPDVVSRDEGWASRKAYLIDSLKHPEEVAFLHDLFGDQFWLVGVVSSDLTRLDRLEQRKGFTKAIFDFLSEDDADGVDKRDTSGLRKSGQAAVKTVLEADYFFSNDFATKDEIESDAARLTRLVFGIQVVSPTDAEVGMNAAYQASLRSACLSRQVGAAIVSEGGEILGTGYNDVPKFGGGLYGPAPSNQDRRCWAWGAKCYNDEEKLKITRQVVKLLADSGFLPSNQQDQAVEALRKSRISGLIEFTRAVHAEMEAMLSIARVASIGLVGSTLYTTTYPCHNCAKHIVDAGIRRVVYLEPYEKSLARSLHSDAINDPLQERSQSKVSFDTYGGVAPRRFHALFLPRLERKNRGAFIDLDRNRHDLAPAFHEEAATVEGRIQAVRDWLEPATEDAAEAELAE